MTLFDTHAHYDHSLFDGNGHEILKRLFTEKVINGVVIPAITYESNFNREQFPAASFPNVYFAAGLHPKYVLDEEEWTDEREQTLVSLIRDPRTVAVKTGMDLSWKSLSEEKKKRQREFLGIMNKLAHQFRLPVVLHVRDASAQIIDFYKEALPEVEIEVHCFTYDYETAVKMMDVGITRFGIGGMLTRDGMDSLRDCVRKLPLSTILVETDAPFVKPKGFEGPVNTSETLSEVTAFIAELKGISVTEVSDAVQANAADFFRIQDPVRGYGRD